MADRQVGAAGTSKEARKEGGTSSAAAAAAITRLHRLADYSPAEEQRYIGSSLEGQVPAVRNKSIVNNPA